MSRLPNQYLTALTTQRIGERDRLIRRQGREIARWAVSVEQRLLGMVHADRGGTEGVTGSVDVFLLGLPIAASNLMFRLLVEMWEWSWDSAVENMVRAVPMEVWMARMAPLRVGENLQEVAGLDFEVEIEPILNGTATAAEARALVERFEFPAPSADRVEAILRGTHAPDGMDAMTRIKTVMPQDLDRLRSAIVSAMSDPARASAIQALAPQIKDLVGGVQWKAQRIARTEGMRIAEAGQLECNSQVDDMITGYKAMTAFDANVRREHRVWHDQLYKRITAGRYVHPTLGDLPQFPAGPNCRCWAVPQLATDLTRGLPPVQLGGQYGRALARFKAQGLAGFEKKVAKRAARKVVKPKARKKVPRKRVAPLVDLGKRGQAPIGGITKPLVPSGRKAELIPKPVSRESALRKRQSDIATKKVEHSYVIDANGKEVLHKSGTSTQVDFSTAEIKQMRGATLTHNHPVARTDAGAVIRDLSLSGEDARFLMVHRLDEMQAVTDKHVFSLRLKKGAKITDRRAHATRISRAWNREVDQRSKANIRKLVPDIRAGKITQKQALRLVEEAQGLDQHEAWLTIADKFNLDYKRIARL